LLSLRYSMNNLILNECPESQVTLSHQVGMGMKSQEPADLIAGVLREGEGREAIALTMRQAAEQLAPGGTILVVASSTAVTRLVKVVQSEKLLEAKDRRRYKGRSLLALKRK